MSKLVDALIKKYEGEVMVAKANIEILLHNPNGVADHPDMAGTLDGLVRNLHSAQEQLAALKCLETNDKEFLQD